MLSRKALHLTPAIGAPLSVILAPAAEHVAVLAPEFGEDPPRFRDPGRGPWSDRAHRLEPDAINAVTVARGLVERASDVADFIARSELAQLDQDYCDWRAGHRRFQGRAAGWASYRQEQHHARQRLRVVHDMFLALGWDPDPNLVDWAAARVLPPFRPGGAAA